MAWNYYGPYNTYEDAEEHLQECKEEHESEYGEKVLGKQWQIRSKADGFYVRIRTKSLKTDCPV